MNKEAGKPEQPFDSGAVGHDGKARSNSDREASPARLRRIDGERHQPAASAIERSGRGLQREEVKGEQRRCQFNTTPKTP